MNLRFHHGILGVFLLLCATAPLAQAAEPPIDFGRQIRPILANNCLKCHGPDAAERQAGLRLDVRESAVAAAESGEIAIVPGKPETSELIKRVTATDADMRMPPAETKKSLTEVEIGLLRRWVAEGAKFQSHWAFVAPSGPAIPDAMNASWARGPIDRFLLARLEREGLAPSAEASRQTLIRRLTLDLTGLPPTLAEIDAFLADSRPDAYERLVDRLLASPHYGERMALDWLDAARFADTHGYHIDAGRDMTRWREYVIDAFNRNVPFDQFTVEQLAGDLLPETGDPRADLRQKLASGFNRNHMINFEGGAIPAGVSQRLHRRSRQHDRHRVARPDGRLRAVPRPQVRPAHAARVLSALRLLQQRARERARRPQGQRRRRCCEFPSREQQAAAQVTDEIELMLRFGIC